MEDSSDIAKPVSAGATAGAGDAEAQRLEAMRRYDVLDAPPGESLDRLARLAAAHFDTPIAIVSFVGEEVEWFKARFGLDVRQIPREVAFCPEVLATPEVMVIEDATEVERYCDNPFVKGDPGIVFYAGAPLVTPDGYRLGTFCVMDMERRSFGAPKRARLEDFAAAAMDVLEQRRVAEQHRQSVATLRRRVSVEEAVRRISGNLLGGEADLDAVLATVGEAVGAEKAYLFRLDEAGERMDNTHEWTAPGTPPTIERKQNMRPDALPWWFARLRTSEVVRVQASDLPPEAEAERAYVKEVNVESLLDVPIRLSDGTLYGHVGFHAGSHAREWTDEDVHMLRVIGDLLAGYFDREASRKALRESEQQFRLIAETVTQVLWVSTADKSSMLYVSPAYEEIWGRSREDLYENALVWLDGVHPDDRARVRAHLQQEQVSGEYDREYRIVRPHGEVRWVRDRAVAARGADGRVERIVGTAEDITERKRREQALHESERRFRSVVENARDVIFQHDAEGRWTLLSPSWEYITGYAVEESLGTRFTEYLHPDQSETVAAYRERVVGDEGMAAEDEVRLLTKDGETRWVRVRSRLLRDEEGRIQVGTGTLSDITESVHIEAEREARWRAEELLEAKTSFLNNMSHELRTPLASILGFAEVLSEEGEGEQQEFAEHIARSGQRLQKTLDSVLSIAQFEGGGAADLDLAPTDTAAEVREAAAANESAAARKDLFLRVDTPEDETRARAMLEAGAFYRVLDNLLSNAIKFTEEGGVTVQVVPEAEVVRIRVADTGVGIGESFQERLFEDFTQESTGLGRSHEGSGLGLAITKRLVDQMNGTVEVASAEGEGTAFTVNFPRAEPAAAQREPSGEDEENDAAEAAAPPDAPEARLLVVEDNPDTRALTRYLLRPRFEVACVARADEALARAKERASSDEERPFDALLIDINLGTPEDGIALLHRLREIPAQAQTPAVAFTAHAMPGDEEHYRDEGFEGYLAKPFTKSELLAVVEEAVHMPATSRA